MTLSTKAAKELHAAYRRRDEAVRCWEAAKKSATRGAALAPYEELKASERRIDTITGRNPRP
jgi:hypothetical protein